MMNRRKNKTGYIIIILILFITIGYALLERNLDINGTTYISGNTWDIHFENVQVSSGSVALSQGNTAAAVDNSDTTTVTFSVSLQFPGDYYEFTVDAVNDGSISGMIEEITTTLDGEEITTLPAYLDYSITYSNGDALDEYQLLATNTTETFKVKVMYKDNIGIDDLPENAQEFDFSFSIKYKQSDSSAIPAHS